MQNSKSFTLCNEIIHPGESLSIALHLPQLYSCLPAYMPIKVFHGKKEGPTFLILSAINGDELNGIEVINRLLGYKRIEKLFGTLIAIPVVNVFGLANKSRYLPGDVLLSERFPGSAQGTHADRLAHLFTSEIFNLADFVVALRTGPPNYSIFPEISTDLNREECQQMAKVFQAPVTTQAKPKEGSLFAYAQQEKKNFITFTAGEANRFDSASIKLGLKGIINLMTHLKMIPEKRKSPVKPTRHAIMSQAIWVRTAHSGISTNRVKLGQQISKGTVLSLISDPFGNIEVQNLLSPTDGIVVGINNVPLVKEGESLFKIALFSEPDKAASHLARWEFYVAEQD